LGILFFQKVFLIPMFFNGKKTDKFSKRKSPRSKSERGL